MPRYGDIHANGHAGIAHRQDVDGRPDKEKGDGRPQPGPPGPLSVDAGKEGQDSAGTDRQNKAAHGRHRIGYPFGRLLAQEACDGFFGDQRRHRAGDEKGRYQAEQNVSRQIGCQAARP